MSSVPSVYNPSMKPIFFLLFPYYLKGQEAGIFAASLPQMPGTGTEQSPEPGAPSGSPTWFAGSPALGPAPVALGAHISGKLEPEAELGPKAHVLAASETPVQGPSLQLPVPLHS